MLLIAAGAFVSLGPASPAAEFYISKENPTVILIAGAETPVLSRDQVPKTFKSKDGEFRLGDNFSSVALSPARNQLAFSLRGTHDWAGVLDLRTREIRELTFSYGGTIEKLIWSPDNQHLVVQGLSARGRRFARIVSTLNGEVLAIDNLPLPWGDVDIYDHSCPN